MMPKIGIRAPLGGILWASGLQNDVKMTPRRHHFWGLAPKPWKLRFCCYIQYLRHVSHPLKCPNIDQKSMQKGRSQKVQEKTSTNWHCRVPCVKKGAQRTAQGLQIGAWNGAKIIKNRCFGQPDATELHFPLPGGPWRWVPAQKASKICTKYDRNM